MSSLLIIFTNTASKNHFTLSAVLRTLFPHTVLTNRINRVIVAWDKIAGPYDMINAVAKTRTYL